MRGSAFVATLLRAATLVVSLREQQDSFAEVTMKH